MMVSLSSFFYARREVDNVIVTHVQLMRLN